MTEQTHSDFGGSTMARLMACPGSVREIIEGSHENLSGEAAERGTRIHKAAELLMTTSDPDELEALSCLDQDEADMVDDYCGWLIATAGPAFIHIELPVDLSAFAPGAYGAVDAAFMIGSTLHVVDLKTGWLPVEVEQNPQLMFYALGAAMHEAFAGVKIERVRLTVWQGFAKHWECDLSDLLAFGDKLADAVALARTSAAEKHAGPHCRYCPAAATCEALRARLAGVGLEQLAPEKFDTPEAMAEALDVAEVADVFAKAVKGRAEALMADGLRIPGWIREPGRSSSKWKETDEDVLLAQIEQLAPEAGVPERELMRPKTISQVKKILGKERAKAVDALTVKTPGALKLKRQQSAEKLFGI
jgi:hypothetical protein